MEAHQRRQTVMKRKPPSLKRTAENGSRPMSINSRNAASIDELRRTNGSDVAPRAALEQFSHQLAQAYEEVHLLFRFARLLNSVDVPEQLIQIFCNQLFPVLPFSWLAVRFHPKGTSVRELSQRLFLSGQPPCSTAEFEEHSRALIDRLVIGKGPQVLRPQDDP